MKKLYPLTGTVQNYDWGSTSAMTAMFGIDNPQGLPQAELWYGVHQRGESQAIDGKKQTPLSQLIRSDVATLLGSKAAHKFPNLPFLFKGLVADRALSIQVHPNHMQAQAGFSRESAAGIPIDAPHRNYRDSHHKPEIICALSQQFWAMSGFRPIADIIQDFTDAQLPSLAPVVKALTDAPDERGLKTFFTQLMSIDKKRIIMIVDAAIEYASTQSQPHWAWIEQLAEQYPGDIGALAPLYLNVVCLQAGQAMYLGAGHLHAYLQGVGVELMANSDNVLRAGLTSKHIDIDELMHVAIFHSHTPEILEAEGSEGRYATPSHEFALCRVSISEDYFINGRNPAQIILCTKGRLRIETAAGNPGESQSLIIQRGEAVFMPHHAGGYVVSGKGEIFMAQIPD